MITNEATRREMIMKTASKHEEMFATKLLEQMFSGFDKENSIDTGDTEGDGNGMFGGKYGGMLVKPMLMEAVAKNISGTLGIKEFVAKAMCKKEGLSYEPSTNITA